MGFARTLAVTLDGIQGLLVEVECDISAGLPGTSFTGRADKSVVESRDRLRAAVHNSGVRWPQQRVTVALLPADVPKSGARYDLAIGLAVLAADREVPADAVGGVAWIGGLGLDGAVRPVRGVLPSVVAAQAAGVRRVVVAAENAAEAALVDGVDVRAADDLGQIVRWLRGEGPSLPAAESVPVPGTGAGPDLADVAGQATAKRALEIAAAGGHHLHLVGAPGAGKTMLAERLPGLLPPLDDAASLEVSAVHSIAGLLGEHAALVRRPPFQAPHHTTSAAALVGGGSGVARPGAASLAHRGVLFLDEAPEFAPTVLDALRQPLESGRVTLPRSGGTASYPARFQLVLAANPCACSQPGPQCQCSSRAHLRYRQRMSGPLMDRVDLRVTVDPVPHTAFFDELEPRVDTVTVAARVAAARRRARQRWAGLPWSVNADAPGAALRSSDWLPPRSALLSAERALSDGRLSARGFDRVLRTAWTVADLDAAAVPDGSHVAEALALRVGDRAEAAA
ncbi:YifB family Mg chelatase-like AAA ATPase [Jatrophihabitans fulvus]